MALTNHPTSHLTATLSCTSPSRKSIKIQCKNPGNVLSNWSCSCHLESLKGTKQRPRRVDLSWNIHSAQKFSSSTVACQATNTAKNKIKFSRDELTESQLENWQEASGFLEGLGFNREEADKILAKAFGWVYSPYWSETLVQTIPELGVVSSKVDFVKDLGLSQTELTSLLKKFPELLGCRETLMKHNIGILDKDWGIAGKTLKNVIIRNPQILGYSVDCKGDCMAQCTRCWVRF